MASSLTVRRLSIDLQAPFDRHWLDGDAFASALFGALSMSFPVGEQFFIDSVRRGLRALATDAAPALRDDARCFIGQEATHRHLHGQFNAQLERQGLVNAWGPRAERRLQRLAEVDARHWVAITAANEHFTAILAEWVLTHPTLLDRTEPRLATLWRWHSAEETEHRSLAFDLYRALGGDEARRTQWFGRITVMFLGDLARQTIDNLRRDGTLWRWSTWRGAASFLFGRHGMLSANWRAWRRYLRADFHPSQQPDEVARRWLADHADRFAVVGG